MNNNSVNPAKAYLDGMLWAAFGSALYFGKVADWQIEAVKKCASKLRKEGGMVETPKKRQLILLLLRGCLWITYRMRNSVAFVSN